MSDDIRHDLWRKFAFIVPITVACGLARRPAGAVLATERGRGLFTGALDEIVAVCPPAGGRLTDEDVARLRDDFLGRGFGSPRGGCKGGRISNDRACDGHRVSA